MNEEIVLDILEDVRLSRSTLEPEDVLAVAFTEQAVFGRNLFGMIHGYFCLVYLAIFIEYV